MHRYQKEILISLALAMATGLVYARVCHFPFVNYDDDTYVLFNPHVRSGISQANFYWAVTTLDASNWHPLTWLSLQLDSSIYGPDNPGGYHFTNLLLHVANTILLFLVLCRATGTVWPGALVAALFALHPLHVESVAWVAERKDVLSTLFWMLCLLAYVAYVQHSGLARYFFVMLALTLGLLSKPMLVTLPFVLLLVDFWPLNRCGILVHSPLPLGDPAVNREAISTGRPASRSFLLAEKLPLFALAIASSVMTVIAQHKGEAMITLDQIPLAVRMENAVIAMVSYLTKSFWPDHLAVFYPHPTASMPPEQVLGACLVLIGVSLAAIVLARRYPYFVVGWFWFLGTLVPVIGLVQVGLQAMADRYTYVPLIGLFLVLAWASADLIASHPRLTFPVCGGAGLLIFVCAMLTWRQVGFWQDGETLWRHTVELTNDNFVAHNNLGMALDRQNRPVEAEEEFKKAVALKPDLLPAQTNLGVLYIRRGEISRAIEFFKKAAQIGPDNPMVHNHMGMALTRLGKLDEAIEELSTTLRLDPTFAMADNNLAMALLQRGRLEEAKEHLLHALQLDPNDAEARNNIGMLLCLHGDLEEGMTHYRESIKLQPGSAKFYYNLAFALHEHGQTDEANAYYREGTRLDPRWPVALAQFAWGLATAPEEKNRNGLLAVFLAKQACQATGGQQPEPLDALAAACAETGAFDAAVTVAHQALAVAGSAANSNLPLEIKKRLLFYERHQAFHSSKKAS